MTKRLHSDSRIQAIYNAISAQTGVETPMTTAGMAEAISEISGGADLIKILQGNSLSNRFDCIDDVVKTEATALNPGIFRELWINRINLSTIEEVGGYAFYACSASGREIKLPNCKVIGEYAFKDYSRGDDPINTLDLSNVESVAQYAFQRAKLQCNINLPKCKNIYNNAFQEIPMTGLNVPLLENVGQNAFNSNWCGFDVELPNIITIGNNAFACFGSVNFTIGPNCTSIGSRIFGSNGVTNLFVQAVTPPTLAYNFKDTNAGVQHIYVPAESVEDYKAASVWSGYASIIEAIPS